MMIHAPAKTNLTLELLGSRPDGYHQLRSLLMPISLVETIDISLRPDETVTCSTTLDGIPPFDMDSVPLEKHLAVKALRSLHADTQGADIHITKRTPVGAGLGGGSADAAGTLRALNEAWHLDLSKEALAAAGATFASDVPGMVLGGPVLMEGRGEQVKPLNLPPQTQPLWLVLAFCGEPISTRDVYAACPDTAIAPNGCQEHMLEAIQKGDPHQAAEALFNGLEKTVYSLSPHTAELPNLLLRAGAIATLLSGSGGTVFGLAENKEHAHSIAKHLPHTLWHHVVSTNAPFILKP